MEKKQGNFENGLKRKDDSKFSRAESKSIVGLLVRRAGPQRSLAGLVIGVCIRPGAV